MPRPDPLRTLFGRPGLQAFRDGLDIESLWRWVKLSVLVGLVTGLIAAGAYYLLELSERQLLYGLVGYQDPGAPQASSSVWWLVLLIPAAGGLLAGLSAHFFCREGGQGVHLLILSFHERRGVLRAKEALARFVASIFVLGTGGSAGREGPTAHIGGAFGSLLAQRLKLSARDRRLLLLAGAAGGISAMFRTPLGAAIWALEVLYRDDVESEGMFPCLVSSVTAYSVFTSIHGTGSLFSVPQGGYSFEPVHLLSYAALGVVCAPVGLIWVKSLSGGSRLFRAMPIPGLLKPALGGLCLGAMALLLPWVLGSGYGWIQNALRALDDPLRQLPVGLTGAGILLAMAGLKIGATVLSVCSGGSGGVVAPSLFIGGFVGGAFGLFLHDMTPTFAPAPGAFVLVGMGAMYAGIAHVPLSTIILISELFGSYDLLVPLMLAVMVSFLLLRRIALHPAQVGQAHDSPAHSSRFTVDILSELRVDKHFSQGRATEPVPVDMSLAEFLQHVSSQAETTFVVKGQGGELTGLISLENVRAVLSEDEFLSMALVNDAMTPLVSVAPDTDLATALRTMTEAGGEYLPVIDPKEPQRILGLLSQRQIAAAYHADVLARKIGRDETLAPD